METAYMETTSMKPKNNFNFVSNHSGTKNCFLIAAESRCIHGNHYISSKTDCYQISDIEMITLEDAYTSLKDLLPSSPSTTTVSPTATRMDSWREIPIRDPLLQHAAWAYLQPMEASAPSDDRNLFEKCCGFFGCFSDVLLLATRGWFSRIIGRRREAREDDDGGKEEEEDRVDLKV